jgi:large subunit ribosomal protein L17
MHRHGYQGRKLHRERDQREALIKGLADSLIQYEKIETTMPKAKEVVPYLEKLITKAKKGDLHNRRQVIAGLQTITNIAPKLKGRNSGHLKITRSSVRRGDNAQLVIVSFVDDLNEAPVAKSAEISAANVEAPEVPISVEPVDEVKVAKPAKKKSQENK